MGVVTCTHHIFHTVGIGFQFGITAIAGHPRRAAELRGHAAELAITLALGNGTKSLGSNID